MDEVRRGMFGLAFARDGTPLLLLQQIPMWSIVSPRESSSFEGLTLSVFGRFLASSTAALRSKGVACRKRLSYCLDVVSCGMRFLGLDLLGLIGEPSDFVGRIRGCGEPRLGTCGDFPLSLRRGYKGNILGLRAWLLEVKFSGAACGPVPGSASNNPTAGRGGR